MLRILVVAAVLVWHALVGSSPALAAEKIIEAQAPKNWVPPAIGATVGDEIVWVMNDANPETDGHGVEIINWDDVKDHVEIVTVAGQLPFNPMTGQNDEASTTVGQVLLRLKIKSLPTTEIKYWCIVHTTGMQGSVRIAPAPSGPIALGRLDKTQALLVPSSSGTFFLVAPDLEEQGRIVAIPVDLIGGKSTTASITTVKSFASPSLRWEKDAEEIELGKEIQWVNGGGLHGLRITNWNEVKDAIEVIEVNGTPDNFEKTGETPPSREAAIVHARLKVNSFPPTTDAIEYECSFHGDLMTGTVKIRPAVKPASEKPRRSHR